MAEKSVIGNTTIIGGQATSEDVANHRRFYNDEPQVDQDPINGTNWKKTWDPDFTSKKATRE